MMMRKYLQSAVSVGFAVTGALVIAACFTRTTDVLLLRGELPSLPEGCPVSMLADDTAPFPVEDLVVLNVSYTPGGREVALRNLREKACYYGGDTVYRLRERPRSNTMTDLKATLARRRVAAPATSASASSAAGAWPVLAP